MAIDLESLHADIEGFLEQSNLVAFYGFTVPSETSSVYWDIKRAPDFRDYLKVAERAGAKIIVVNREQFLLDEIDDVRDQLEDSSLSREEKRSLEHRIQELQRYEGFTARVELSFILESRRYVFSMEAEWFRIWDEILLEIDSATEDSQDLDDGSMSGYFSAN